MCAASLLRVHLDHSRSGGLTVSAWQHCGNWHCPNATKAKQNSQWTWWVEKYLSCEPSTLWLHWEPNNVFWSQAYTFSRRADKQNRSEKQVTLQASQSLQSSHLHMRQKADQWAIPIPDQILQMGDVDANCRPQNFPTVPNTQYHTIKKNHHVLKCNRSLSGIVK